MVSRKTRTVLIIAVVALGNPRRTRALVSKRQCSCRFTDISWTHVIGCRSHFTELYSTPNENHGSSRTIRHRRRQIRRKNVNRKPRSYWLDLENVRKELRQLWASLGVVSDCIPNESFLNHFERHDLRNAIVTHGGRESLSKKLGNAAVMPGNWSQAVETCRQLQEVLSKDPSCFSSLSPSVPPLSPQQKKSNVQPTSIEQRWKHSRNRKPKGYWSLKVLIQELFEYLDMVKETQGRPSVWMPRTNELPYPIRCALNRFGGANRICKLCGLVPYREWQYMEGMYTLLLELKRYLKETNGDENEFPVVVRIQEHGGYDDLYALIQRYGGRKFLACRLGMKHSSNHRQLKAEDYDALEMNWGPFSLEFAIELLEIVRKDHLYKRPPLRHPFLAIPSERKLRAIGRDDLHAKILQFGGYENVARRLGLVFDV